MSLIHCIWQVPGTGSAEGSSGETICAKLTNLRKEFESKLYNARCAAEECSDENARLQNCRNDLIAQLNEEEAAQKRAEQDAEKLRLTLRFERDLHRQEMKEVCKQSKISNQRNQFQILEKFKAQLNDSLNTLRGQLEDQLRLNHFNFDNQMKMLQGPAMTADTGGGAVSSIAGAQASLASTSAQIADLQTKLTKCQANIRSLEMQSKYWEKILHGDRCQIDNLERIIGELCHKYQKLLDDKVKIQNELDTYNTMLQGEEKRLNLAHMCDGVTQEIQKSLEKCEPGGRRSRQQSRDGRYGCDSDKKTFEFEIDIYCNKETC